MLLLNGLVAFLIGSLPTGYLMGRAKGVDIRKAGSGNIGATNVFRTLGRGPGLAVFAIDAFKGFAACRFLGMGVGPGSAELVSMICGFCAILGHNYTPWLGFKGGKGIATSFGVLLGLTPLGLLVALATWLLALGASRYVSLASILAALVLPAATWLVGGSPKLVLMTVLVSSLAIYKHKANIRRLLDGTENRFGSKGAGAKPDKGVGA
jgi:glycerol-3-phosphate acyltransferase PlsY